MNLGKFTPRQRIVFGVEIVIGLGLLAALVAALALNLPSRQPTPTPTEVARLDDGTPGITPLPKMTPTTPPTRRVPSATPPATLTPVTGGAKNNKPVVDAIERTTDNTRGWRLVSDLPVEYYTQGQASTLFPALSPTREARAKLAWDAEMAALGFTYQPRLGGAITDQVRLLVPELTGYYDVNAGKLVIVSEHAVLDEQERANLPHYYLHAVQDQLYGLRALRARAGTTDQRLALEALIEGDAVLTMGLAMQAPPGDPGAWAALARQAQTFERLSLDAPAPSTPLGEIDAFAYLQGVQFTQALRKSGWARINQQYQDLPASTEQILHPNKLNDAPQALYLTDLSPWLGGNWGLLAHDTAGEFVLGLHLREALAPGQPVNRDKKAEQRAWDAVAGWDGDTIHVYGDGSRRAWVLLSAWDSTQEAAQFLAAYRDVLRVKISTGKNPREVETTDKHDLWENDQMLGYVSQQGSQVLIVYAPDQPTLSTILALTGGF